ncbi:MAG: hypothetical protein ACREQJ_03080, partial [Candidatus Binatia bacterium]
MNVRETFLSESWFEQVDEIQRDAPRTGPTLNLVVVDGPEGPKRVHVAGTRFAKNHDAGAAATVTLPFEIAHAIFV